MLMQNLGEDNITTEHNDSSSQIPSNRHCVNFEKGDFMRIVVLKFKVIYDTKNYNSPLEFIDCLPGENKCRLHFGE